jgi:hypothetical protein
MRLFARFAAALAFDSRRPRVPRTQMRLRKPPAASFLLGLGRPIGVVAEHVFAGVSLVQQRLQHAAVVHRRVGHLVIPDQLWVLSAFTWFL